MQGGNQDAASYRKRKYKNSLVWSQLFPGMDTIGEDDSPPLQVTKQGLGIWMDRWVLASLFQLKITIFEPPVLTRPAEGENLYLYLTVAEEPQSALLIRETEGDQRPVYFVSKVL